MTSKHYKYFRSTFYFKGKRYEKTGKTQREADRKADELLRKLESGETGISSNMTVKRWVYEWLETYKKPNNTVASYKNNLRLINNFILPTIKTLKLNDITDMHLQKILNSMSNYSEDYIKKVTGLMQSIFKQARISRMIIYDPAENLQKPKGKEPETRRSITDFERKHILSVAETHQYGLMVKTILYTGIRVGELRALTWQHIDFNNKYLYIRQAIAAETEDIKKPKSKSGIRDIPIIDILYKDMIEAKEQAFANGATLFDFVFTQIKTGKRHTKSSISKARKSFYKAVDISMGAKYEKQLAVDGKFRQTLVLSVIDPKLDFYTLRHTYCTDLQKSGINIEIASYLMGHSKIELTNAIYTHMSKDVLENVRNISNGGNFGVKKITNSYKTL